MKVEFFFDLSSPFTYLGYEHIQMIAARHGVPVIWRPIVVGGIFNAINKGLYAERDNPAVPRKADYMAKNIADWARVLGLTVNIPPACGHPVNAILPMRTCLALQKRGESMLPFATAGFRALWVDGLNIGEVPVVIDLLRTLGADVDGVLADAATSEIKDLLRANTDEVIARGGFGSPTIFIDETDLYFGNDSMPLVEAAIRRSLAG